MKFLDAPREFCDPLQGRHTRGGRSKDNVRRKFMSTPIRRIRSDVAATAARVLAKCRPEGAALPAEIRLFAPVLRTWGCWA